MPETQSRRVRVGTSSWRGWLVLVLAAVGLAALLLTGSIDPPPPSSLLSERIYTVQQHAATSALVALDGTGQPLFEVPGVRTLLLAPDGAILFALADDFLLALDPQTGAERWRVATPDAWRSPTEPVLFFDRETNQLALLVKVLLRSPYLGDSDVLFVALHDPRTGREIGRVPLGSVRQVRRVLISASGRFLYQSYFNNTMRVVDLHQRRDLLIARVPPNLQALVLAPDETMIYGLRPRTSQLALEFLDPVTLEDARDRQVLLPTSLQPLPFWAADSGSNRLALPLSSTDSLGDAVNQIWLIDPLQPAAYQTIPVTGTLSALAFGGPDVFAATVSSSGPQLIRYTPTGLSALPLAHPATQLLVAPTSPGLPAPALLARRFGVEQPLAPLPQTSQPLQASPPAVSAPAALSAPSAQPETWFMSWNQRLNAQDVYRLPSASSPPELIADHVALVVKRPHHAPLLLGDLIDWQSGIWLLDGDTETRLKLDMPPVDLTIGCALHPGGVLLACVDGWERRLWVINTIKGSVRELPQTTTAGVSLKLRLLGWSERYGLLLLVQGAVESQVWRVDPAGATPPEALLTTTEAVFDARHNQLLYITLQGFSLHAYNLASGRDTPLISAPDSLEGFWALDPTGAALVFAEQARSGYDLLQIDLDSGQQRRLRSSVDFVPGSLVWSDDGTTVVFREHEPADSPQPQRLWMFDALGLVGYTTYALPGSPLSVLPLSPTIAAAVIRDETGFALLSMAPGSLQRIPLPDIGPPQTVIFMR